ncbi:MAG: type VI secretion system membrane subunit TssM [Aquisalimonadaceae bacterium]
MALIGVIALSMLIWFAGPLLGIADYKPLAAESWRFATILLLLVVWGLNNLRLRSAEGRANEALTRELVANADAERTVDERLDAESNAERAVLAARLKQALGTLQQSRRGRGRKLYQLPWYVIIGSPGSGKTTTLRNSGLRFPLQSEIGDNAVQGAGGTRYCDWWFTNDAVLIDTAGRYTSQDNPRRTEAQAWLGFLGLLKKSRPKRPLNGIVVAVSIIDLVNRTPTQLALQATAIKRRIQELNSHLAMQLPVYVLFTKCDLIAGFNEYFADLDQEGREQVWGITLPAPKGAQGSAALAAFPRLYQDLVVRADDRVLHRLHAERDGRRRALVFEFPRQMMEMSDRLHVFLKDIFSRNQFEQPSLLRGVYFISGTQTNSAGTWVGGVVPTALCAPPISAAGTAPAKSFFITRVLSDIIFREAELATASSRAARRFRWSYRATFAAVCMLFVGSSAAWYISHQANSDYMERVHGSVTEYEQSADDDRAAERTDWLSLANDLGRLRDLYREQQAGHRIDPVKMGFGLSQVAKIEAQVDQTYRSALEYRFMPALTVEMLRQLDVAGAEEDYLYEALRFYLMLYHPDKFKADEFSLWADLLWQRQLPGDHHQLPRDQLGTHLAASVEARIPPPPMDRERVAAARDVLARTPLERRIYRRLKNDYMQEHGGQFTVEQVLGSRAEALFRRRSGTPLSEGVPDLFTYSHFHTGFSPRSRQLAEQLTAERWIYGDDALHELSDAEITTLTEQVRALYFQEYTARWQALLDDLVLNSFRSASHGRVVLRLLAANDAPLMSLLQAIRRNTALAEAPQVSKAVGEVADVAADEVMRHQRRRLDRLVPDSVSGGAISLPGSEVNDFFLDLNAYVVEDEGMPLHRLQEALEGLNTYFDTLAHAGDLSQAAFDASRDPAQGSGAATDLRRALSAAPRVVQRWFEELPASTQRVTSVAALGHVNDVWRSQVLSFYTDAIKGRYPVDPNATVDIRLDDLATFFGPGGILDSYFESYIKPFVDTSRPQWRWSSPVAMSRDSLKLFQRAERIRRAYFGGGESLRVGFMLKPYSLERVVTRSLLETSGTQILYQHGPIRSALVEWPGQSNDLSRIAFNLASRGTPVSTRIEGEWSLFRLLDRHAETEPMPDGNGLLVTFNVDGIKAQYALLPRSTHHPFGDNPLRFFSLPESL